MGDRSGVETPHKIDYNVDADRFACAVKPLLGSGLDIDLLRVFK